MRLKRKSTKYVFSMSVIQVRFVYQLAVEISTSKCVFRMISYCVTILFSISTRSRFYVRNIIQAVCIGLYNAETFSNDFSTQALDLKLTENCKRIFPDGLTRWREHGVNITSSAVTAEGSFSYRHKCSHVPSVSQSRDDYPGSAQQRLVQCFCVPTTILSMTKS